MFWLRLSGWLFVLFVVATALVMLLGTRLPPNHITSLTVVVHASPDRVWALLTDPAAQARWRSDVSSTDTLPDDRGLPCWQEMHDHTPIPVCVVESTPQRSLTLRSAGAQLPLFWERRFQLAPDAVRQGQPATRLTLTESVVIGPAMVRFYDHYVFDEGTQLQRLLADLEHAVSPAPPAEPSIHDPAGGR